MWGRFRCRSCNAEYETLTDTSTDVPDDIDTCEKCPANIAKAVKGLQESIKHHQREIQRLTKLLCAVQHFGRPRESSASR